MENESSYLSGEIASIRAELSSVQSQISFLQSDSLNIISKFPLGRDETINDNESVFRRFGFGWMGKNSSNQAIINEGYIVTFGGLIIVPKTNVSCTGTRESPGVLFCEIKRGLNPASGGFEGYTVSLICTTLSSFPGHTNDAWRFPLYLVYVSSGGTPRMKLALGIGLICI